LPPNQAQSSDEFSFPRATRSRLLSEESKVFIKAFIRLLMVMGEVPLIA
jgi:hypothetical protein